MAQKYSSFIALASLVIAATLFSVTNLLWIVRDGVEPLSTNSEFFAYSWVYAVRWAHGERYVFLPHSQILLAAYGLIDWLFTMTSTSASHIIAGWRSISLAWPIATTAASIALIAATVDRRTPTLDAFLALGLYLVAIQISLPEQALNSLSYHSLAIPVALGSLPLWAHYAEQDPKPTRFYVGLCAYTIVCALSKPTFLAFAVPFYAMEIANSCNRREIGSAIRAGACGTLAIIVLFLAVYLIGRGYGGFRYQLEKTLEFLRSQATWYDEVKGATPFHWYRNYVVHVMGLLPSALIALTISFSVLSRRTDVIFGATVGILVSLFCLYSRSQSHAEPEFLGMMLATTIAAIRLSRAIPAQRPTKLFATINVVAFLLSLTLAAWTFVSPPATRSNGFSALMSAADSISVPLIFEQEKKVQTLILQLYPNVIWGVPDAWCRGSTDIFGGRQSRMLDRIAGNVTCMHGAIDPVIDLTQFTRIVFAISKGKTIAETKQLMPPFQPVFDRFNQCNLVDGRNSQFDLVVCEAPPPVT